MAERNVNKTFHINCYKLNSITTLRLYILAYVLNLALLETVELNCEIGWVSALKWRFGNNASAQLN